ncbi:MAG: hypothetical protein ACTSQF_00095 [Candidatus Heimdallarchaeaceae archaeon]
METVDQLTKMRNSYAAKNKKDKAWYKRIMDYLDYRTPFNQGLDSGINSGYGYNFYDYDRVRSKRINYNLYNGVIDKTDFEYVYKPLGEDVGELPADFTNKDIVSGKIKVLLGMEMERTFPWRIVAVNPEATTRKEEKKFGMMREYVIQQIMQPIQEQIEAKMAEQSQGQPLTQEQQQQVQQQVAQELEAMTPPEVENYMKRKHQDPAEMLATQILSFIVKEENVEYKFNKGWRHACISAEEVYWVGIINDEPVITNINPLYFEYDKEADGDFFEDGEWAGVELWLTPSQVVQYFGDELTNDNIDSLYEGYNTSPEDMEFRFDGTSTDYGKIRVLHRAWKALRKMGFVQYIDPETGAIEEKLVGENYKISPALGELTVTWEWIPEVYEGYKINSDIYVRLRPIPSQPKNLENLYECKLPYYGGVYDNINSQPTSLMDRMKVYQYYYNIIMYRIEMLMASDKGKILLLNMNMIPNSQDIDMEKWIYYTESAKIGFMNPNEEGNQGMDISTAAKEIDMSLVSDIQKYIELAEYIEQRCGATIGVTKEMEGRIGQYQAVRTTEQAISQGNYIVEPYFDFHNIIKKNAMTALMNVSVIAYSQNGKEKLNYIMDDFSREIINIDKNLLALSHYGLFVANSMDTIKVKEAINNLSMAAMQNQALDMSDVISVIESDSITDAKEKLKVGEDRKRKELQQDNEAKMAHEKEMAAKADEVREEERKHEGDMIVLKEEERRETELQKQAILALGFAEDKDVNQNQIPDVIEVMREGIDANIKLRKQNLDEKKFDHQKGVDKKKLQIEDKKANQKANKPAKAS